VRADKSITRGVQLQCTYKAVSALIDNGHWLQWAPSNIT